MKLLDSNATPDKPTGKELKTAQEIDPIQEQLSAEEIVFSRLVAKGYSLTSAYRQAFETAKDLANYTVRKYASELATKSNIITEVATTKQRQSVLARLAEERIQDTLENGKEGMATNQVAMFMYDHANGKAMSNITASITSVQLNVDLSA